MAAYLIGIDLGTQSTKSVIFDTEGNVIGQATQEVHLHTPKSNWVEQDPDELYQSALCTIRQAVTESGIDPGCVAALGLDSQIGTMIRIDEDWNHLSPVESYLDTRAYRQRDAIMAEHGRWILDSNGIFPYTVPKLLWWKEEHPEAYARTCKALQLNAYVGGRMAGLRGQDAFVDTTCMGIYGSADIRAFRWSEELVAAEGIDHEKLPQPVRPWQIVGELTPQAAAVSGLVPGIPITAGLGDAIAGWIGVGAVEPGIMVDTSGTANHVGICVDQYQPDHNYGVLTHYPSAIPGQWYTIGYTAGTGRSHSWFIDTLCLSGASEHRAAVYAALEEAAAQVPAGCEGLVFSPHFGGRICPSQPSIRGFWLGMTWKHTTAHLYRAILESIAFEYHVYLKVACALYPDLALKRMIVVGGGARSLLWTRIKADVLGVRHVTCADRADFAPLGAAVVAGHAVGIFPDMAAAVQGFTTSTQEVKPQPSQTEDYRPYAAFYERLFARLEPLFEELGALIASSALAGD